MKLLAPGIGHAGTEQPPSNFVSVVCFIMKKHTLAIGQKMWMIVRNIVSNINISAIFILIIFLSQLCVMTMQMEMFRWENLVTGTGNVREVIQDFRDAPLC